MTDLHISDLFAPYDLADMVEQGYVRQQIHPDPHAHLTILNYTEKAQYESVWNDVTLNCRGLIVEDAIWVKARPFRKFFNYGDPLVGDLDLSAPAVVTDKLDGSLGILYPTPDGHAIATRGSFTSAQAEWATEWFRRYADPGFFAAGNTYLFEIIAPWNRIVVQYDWEGLVLLGIVDTETGCDLDLPADPRLLQARSPRNDRGEYEAASEGLAAVQGVPKGGSEARQPEEPRASECVPQGLAGEERREDDRLQEGQLSENSGSDRRIQAKQALPGLRANLPDLLHGLRPRAGHEEIQRRSSEEPGAISRRGREMRTRLRELSQDQDFYPFKIVTRFEAASLADALAIPPRNNAEGLVVRLLNSGVRVKLKQADYVALHRIVTGLNARTVWEMLASGKTVAEICAPLPDEFHAWVNTLADDLHREARDLLEDTERYHEKVLAGLPEGWARKDYAQAVSGSTLRPWLFNLLDERDPRPAIWKAIRPSGDRRPVNFSEDTA